MICIPANNENTYKFSKNKLSSFFLQERKYSEKKNNTIGPSNKRNKLTIQMNIINMYIIMFTEAGFSMPSKIREKETLITYFSFLVLFLYVREQIDLTKLATLLSLVYIFYTKS